MEYKQENGRKVLIASEGKILQSVTDGSIIGPKVILSVNDSKKHYHEIDVPTEEEE